MKKRKETKLPIIEKKWYQKHGPSIMKVFLVLVVLTSVGFVANKFAEQQEQCVQKNVINNYVCQVVESDSDSGMFGVKCLTK